jgi:3-deoxy-D-manno-octulosonate 8-phosphate phosphatase (KDO 8-P phosphatase)
LAVSVANGVAEAKAAVDYVTQAAGGQGAVREICELILKAQNKWGAVLQRFSR